ncbi:MAG: lipoprotein insertase outer membrane protein LolB [Pseudomonadales bacterium]
MDLPDAADFRIIGKLSVRSSDSSAAGRFIWVQSAERYELEIWGPFGQGRRRLQGDEQTVRLLDGGGQLLLQGPVAQVMRAQLGWELPLGSLRHWVQGRPDPARRLANIDQNSNGRAQKIDQESWQISYPEYFEPAEYGGKPRRLIARGEGYEIRLAISRWEV